MSVGINKKDLDLLRNNPNQLILELQDLIDIIISQFIRSGFFRFVEKQDIKQQINIELINRFEAIQRQYQGKSLLRTYLAVVIRNKCNEILRNRNHAKPGNIYTYNLIHYNLENVLWIRSFRIFYKSTSED